MRPNLTVIIVLLLAAFGIRAASAQDACGAPNAGDCCVANPGPYCADAACCASVCAADPFCCEMRWDELCAGRAVKSCPGCFECGNPQAGDCCVANPNPSCADAACCDWVCASDPFCCETQWDELCAGTALTSCPGCLGCGSPQAGDCCVASSAPYCADAACCASVCASDPFCCESQWDEVCAETASSSCPGCIACGSPQAGDCCSVVSNSGPFCSDAACCEAVCAVDPTCCSVQWDQDCVNAAANSCSACADPCARGDFNDDGAVDALDLAELLANWGPCVGCASDLDGDGLTGATDLAAVLAAWGTCVPRVPSWATLLEAFPNPAVVFDATLRQRIIGTGYAWRVRDTQTGIEMVLIPPGTFQMGCSASNGSACYSNENPVHAVTLTNAFYMGRYEVTQLEWMTRMGSNPSFFQGSSAEVPPWQVSNRPVERVSWNMIAGTNGFLAGIGLRLPTEAEWEYACRAGTTTAFHGWPAQPNGTNDGAQLVHIGWYAANSANQTRPVGQKPGNGFGLHDMSGNVAEWVNDWYSDSYYASSPSTNPPGPASGTSRAFRGGYWFSFGTNDLRSSIRSYLAPGFVGDGVGFRVARTP